MQIRLLRFRWHHLNARSATYRALADLPAFQLKHPLNCILVHAQQGSNRPVTKRWFCLNQLLDWLGITGFHHYYLFVWPIINRTSSHTKPKHTNDLGSLSGHQLETAPASIESVLIPHQPLCQLFSCT